MGDGGAKARAVVVAVERGWMVGDSSSLQMAGSLSLVAGSSSQLTGLLWIGFSSKCTCFSPLLDGKVISHETVTVWESVSQTLCDDMDDGLRYVALWACGSSFFMAWMFSQTLPPKWQMWSRTGASPWKSSKGDFWPGLALVGSQLLM